MIEAVYNALSDLAYGGFGVLVNWLWIGLLATAMVWAAMRYSRSHSGAGGYVVWWMHLGMVLLLPLLIVTVPTMSKSLFQSEPAAGGQAGIDQGGSGEFMHSHASYVRSSVEGPARLEQNRSGSAESRHPMAAVWTERPVLAGSGHAAEKSMNPSALESPEGGSVWLGVLPQSLFILWLAIAASLLARVGRAHTHMCRLKRDSVPFDWSFLSDFESEFRELCGSRVIEVRLTDQISHPMAAGLGRPVILLPSRLVEELSAEDVWATLLHELTHLCRWDDWSKFGQKIIQALVFFHPAVHWVGRQLDFEREVACDERVVELTGNRSGYARCLTRLVQMTTGTGTTLMPGVLSTRRLIFKRFARLLGGHREDSRGAGLRLAVVTGLSVVTVVVAVQIAPVLAVPGQAPTFEELTNTALSLVEPSRLPAGSDELSATTVQSANSQAVPPRAEATRESDRIRPELTLNYQDGDLVAIYDHGSASPGAGLLPVDSGPASEVPVAADVSADDAVSVDTSKPEAGVARASRESLEAADAEGDTGVSDGYFKGTHMSHDDDGSFSVRWSDGREYLQVYLEGEIAFTDDDRGIASISPDGLLEIMERSRFGRFDLTVEPLADGSLSYEYDVDGRSREFDSEGREWLSKVLIDLIRRTGVGAESRVGRILADDGVEGVLDEIYRIESDYVQRLYLEVLLDQPGLESEDYAAILSLIRRDLDSDYEKAELLTGLAGRVCQDETLMEFYIDGAATIDSDYEKRRSVDALMEKSELTYEMLRNILMMARDIESDYERAELLLDLAPRINRQVRSTAEYERALEGYIEAVVDIESDYETRRVLDALILNRNTDRKVVLSVLQVVGQIDSDYEKAELLTDLADVIDDDAELNHAYIQAIGRVASDYELRRIITALSARTDHYSREDLAYLLDLSEMMDSDYDRAELLIDLSDHCRHDDELLGQLVSGVSDIDSDYEKKRVLKNCMPTDCARQEALSHQMLGVIDALDSDYEKAEALLEITPCVAETPSLQGQYLEHVGDIDADYDRRRVLTSFLKQCPVTDDLVQDVLRVAVLFDSDYDKAQLLSDLAPYCRGNDRLEDEFLEVVKTVHSEYDIDRLYRRLYGRDVRNGDDGI